MRDIQVSRPVLIALVGAILVGGFLFFKSKGSDTAPPPPPAQAATTAPTGATDAAGATGATGGSGATGAVMSAAEKAAAKKKAAREKLKKAAEAAGYPLNVYEPLQDGKIVLIFFYTKGGQDDPHVSTAVSKVASDYGSKMKVIREPVTNKSHYDAIAKAADITQTPGILIMYDDQADTWQGYTDAAALKTHVERVVDAAN